MHADLPPAWLERYAANLTAFTEKFPALVTQLRAITTPASRITGSEATGDINLDLGHTTLYPESAEAFTTAQLTYYTANPSRFYMDPPALVDPPYHQQHFLTKALYDHLKEKSIRSIPLNPTPDAGYMLIYGIGLGYHLPVLIDRYPARHFILVDEYLEFFNHTLYLHDWVGILARMAERGQTLRLVFGADPLALSIQVHFDMRGQGFGLIDGSYLYRHYHSTLLDKAYADFREKLPLLPISIGFFEDELVMLDHCTRNLINNSYKLLEERPRHAKPIPAIIVGSGPSLDKTIDVLKKIQHEVAIFSCGTALLPLLRNGIRPDFHCELENGWSSYYQVKQAGDQYGLDGITLIGSTTVWPAMPSLFSDRILYFRDSVSSTGLWCPDRIGILGTAPTCTNLAVRAAMVMCFKDLYLFGVDLGTRDPSAHHSRHAIYHDDKDWLTAQETDPNKRMEIELPGNFGGKAYTNAILHWARMMLIQSIEVFSFARIYNTCDGVSIPGTIPKLAKSIRLDGPPGRKTVTMNRLMQELAAKAPREMVDLAELHAVRAGFADYFATLRARTVAAQTLPLGYIPFYEDIHPFLAKTGNNRFQPVFRSVTVGTLMMCFQVGYYFYRRVRIDDQADVMRAFLTAFDRVLENLAGTMDRLLGDLEASYEEGAAQGSIVPE